MSRRFATAALGLTLTLTGLSLVLIWLVASSGAAPDANDHQLLGELSLGSSYAAVGWLVAFRRAENPLGWVYLGIGLSQVGEAFAGLGALYGLAVAPGSIPGADILAWMGTWAWAPGFSLLLGFSILLFPDGHLPSPRWRPVAWLAVAALPLLVAPLAIAAWPLRGAGLITSTTPPGWATSFELVGLLANVIVAVAGIGAIVVRFRRSSGLERQQLKWFTFAVVPEIAIVVSSGFVTYPPFVLLLAALFITPSLPIAIGIAILRYRLYEIDRIVSRSISWAIVTVAVGSAFAGGVVALQGALADITQGQTLAVAASTLMAFALFQPVRRRVQAAVDQRFDRARYDAQRMSDAFARRVRDEVDLLTIELGLVQTAHQSVRPVSAGVWLRAR